MSYVIANMLKNIRVDRGLSQEEVAKNLNMTRQRYSRLESNQMSITFKLIEEIANFYGISPNEITKAYQEQKTLKVLFRENHALDGADEVIEKIQSILEYMNSHEKLYYRMKEK